ncbi:protein artemis-like isoform X2 [Amphiura filiformis]|uniref:protein artemis-like isoform X2 n=1 Tax=Amphiura filiformis TaxID=82378 RepID=UPI003B218389
MSQFEGLMKEYPQVALDRFQGPAVLRARAYFLSHFHADHMVGLDSKQFIERLKCSRTVKLYASEVTCAFLTMDRKYKFLEPYLASLPIEQPSNVIIPDDISNKDEKLLVTLLPAGHCPGSVMFLFEGDNGNVLYTGDFRLAKGEAARMTHLHSGNRVKDIQSVYLDTTFCIPQAMYIPSREQSRDVLLELVQSQLQKSPLHMVRLACKARYGYEYLYVELSKEFNMKVHVPKRLYVQYEKVPELARYLTADGSSTQIHACRYVDCAMPKAVNVLVITPSTMYFTNPSNAQPSTILVKKGAVWRLCFSFHSSFGEVRDFVEHISPVNIYPNVIPYHNTEEDIINRLKDLTRDGGGSTSESVQYKPLGQLKKTNRLHRKRQRAHGDEDDLADLFGESPRKSRPVTSKDGSGDVNGQIKNNSDEDEADEDSDMGSISSGADEFYPDDDLEYDLQMASQESDKNSQGQEDDKKPNPAPSERTCHDLCDNDDSKHNHEDSDDDIPSSCGSSGDVNSWLKYLPNSCQDDGILMKKDSQSAAEDVEEPDSQETTLFSQKSEGFLPILSNGSKAEHEDDMDEPDSQETTLCSQKSEEFLPLSSSGCKDEQNLLSPTQSSPVKQVDNADEPDSQETSCSQKSNASSVFSIPCTPEAKDVDKEAVAKLQEQLAGGKNVELLSCKNQLF